MKKELNASNKEVEEKITQTLNASYKKVEENLANTMAQKLDNMKKELNASNKKIEEKMAQISNAAYKKVEDNLEEKMTQKLDIIKKELLDIIRVSNQFHCKEESLSYMETYTPLYSMDLMSLRHVTVKKDSSGYLTNFKMHIAIKAIACDIWLTNKITFSDSDIRYGLVIRGDSDQQSYLYNNIDGIRIQKFNIPNIISFTQFSGFYIEIVNGNLQFGKEGDSSPIISYYNDQFKSVNFFQFDSSFRTPDSRKMIRYDCPAPVKGSS